MAIANGEVAWQPNQQLKQFEKDLEFLPLIFAQSNDYLAVHEQPSQIFGTWLNQIFPDLPKCIDRQILKYWTNEHGQYPDELHPWGWSPAMHHQLRYLMKYTNREFRNSPVGEWKTHQRDFYSRKTALKLLEDICQKHPHSGLLPDNYHPVIATTVQEVETQFGQWPQLVLKAPWSSSGRGIQILRYGYLNQSNRQWIKSVIKQQGYLMVEPLLNKQADFSLHYHITENGIDYLGFGRFETNANGQYVKNIIKPGSEFIEQIITTDQLAEWLKQTMVDYQVHKKYRGYAGVDLMLVEINNQLVIHPLVEVNWRYNMGLIALKLEKIIHPKSKGTFMIHMEPKTAFKVVHKEFVEKHPLKFKEHLPSSGYFPLSDPQKAKSGAYVILH